MGPVDSFLSAATNLIYNMQGKLSPGQVAAQAAETNNQIAHAGEVAKASGADPATIDAIVRDYQSRTQGLIEAAVKDADAAPDDNTTPWLLLAAVGLVLILVSK